MDAQLPCPCTSGQAFGACCEPYLTGDSIPQTAERLMRSRFAAFQVRNADYVRMTWDPIKRPKHLNFDQDQRVWSKLDIVDTLGGGEQDDRGVVEFKAYYELGDDTYLFHEVSRFVRHDGRWFYLDASFPFHGKIAHKGQPVKNAPCPCGSGKKYKKCCGG